MQSTSELCVQHLFAFYVDNFKGCVAILVFASQFSHGGHMVVHDENFIAEAVSDRLSQLQILLLVVSELAILDVEQRTSLGHLFGQRLEHLIVREKRLRLLVCSTRERVADPGRD
eukprot:TRINITY_DN113248_c0_g1_i1.p1 TRINITY_DN113248_c0_g1~~TRINITY_DN113248_c0_g1_i1.p1  ORF type:complete len:115 (-),score=12.44 TRINITY_DN113248_c0_g1_i1:148-492(-)